MSSDFKELLSLLNAYRVKYLLVGGYAVIYYTEPRYTGDIDIFVEVSESNARKLYTVLKKFGAPLDRYIPEDFMAPGYFFQIGVPPNRIDILMSMKGVSFERAWSNRKRIKFIGVNCNLVSLEDLIAAKQAAGRSKDKLDLKGLRRVERKRRKKLHE